MKENYESQLLALNPEPLPVPYGCLPYRDLVGLVSIDTVKTYERRLRELAKMLPYQISSWPCFGEYCEDGYSVDVGPLNYQLLYCERGRCDVREDCKNLVDLSYAIFSLVSPNLTTAASKLTKNLDGIKDQRLILWLRMSSEIYHLFQVNRCFGSRKLTDNLIWMCQELVRMGVSQNSSEAFNSERHIMQGLKLSGLPETLAADLYRELQNA